MTLATFAAWYLGAGALLILQALVRGNFRRHELHVSFTLAVGLLVVWLPVLGFEVVRWYRDHREQQRQMRAHRKAMREERDE